MVVVEVVESEGYETKRLARGAETEGKQATNESSVSIVAWHNKRKESRSLGQRRQREGEASPVGPCCSFHLQSKPKQINAKQ